MIDKHDFVRKMEDMIHEGIQNNVYKETNDNTLKDLNPFQDFVYRNFKKHKQYDKMFPSSNQPAKLYGTTKTHKFSTTEEINLQSLKFRPIVARTGTCMYNAAQVISQYLQPLFKDNPLIISNTRICRYHQKLW